MHIFCARMRWMSCGGTCGAWTHITSRGVFSSYTRTWEGSRTFLQHIQCAQKRCECLYHARCAWNYKAPWGVFWSFRWFVVELGMQVKHVCSIYNVHARMRGLSCDGTCGAWTSSMRAEDMLLVECVGCRVTAHSVCRPLKQCGVHFQVSVNWYWS